MVIGHRGARGEWPENTIEGITRAIAAGCEMIEIDVQLTRDGVVVVTHDAALNPDMTRDAAGAWLRAPIEISSLTANALHAFDIGAIRPGSALAARFNRQEPVPPAPVPRLDDVLKLAKKTSVPLLIELKNDAHQDVDAQRAKTLATRVAHDVRAAGFMAHAIFQSFDWRSLRYLREAAPEARLCGLTCHHDAEAPGNVYPGSPWLDGWATRATEAGLATTLSEAGFSTWAPAHTDVTTAQLDKARALDLDVFVWTVNDTAALDMFLQASVAGIITDYPTRALSRREAMAP